MKHKKLKQNLGFSESRIILQFPPKDPQFIPDSRLDLHLLILSPAIFLLKLLLKPGHSSSEILPQESRICSWPSLPRTAQNSHFTLSWYDGNKRMTLERTQCQTFCIICVVQRSQHMIWENQRSPNTYRSIQMLLIYERKSRYIPILSGKRYYWTRIEAIVDSQTWHQGVSWVLLFVDVHVCL